MYRDKQLRGIPVETKRGQRVGRLSGFVIDPRTHAVAQYVVSKNRFLSALIPGELLIHSTQVISLDNEKMIVVDGAVEEKISEALKIPSRQAHPAGTMNRAE